MTAEDAIQVADQVLLAHARNRLTHIQRMILSESWAGKRYEIMEGYASQHIKNEGKELWDLLSEVLGEKVTKTSFKGALEKRLKSGDMVLKPPMPSTYNEQTWVGREAVVSDLLPKLQGQTRLLWIKGISGIGKTTLGECLASKAWEKEPSFQWIYLEILEGQSPDFASVAADLLAKLGDRELDPSERNNPDRLAKRLLQKLQSHRYWIQMDSLERLLNPEQPTEFVDAYWATFLQRFLTESNVISRLVLTAQSFPAAVVEFSDRYPNTWAEYRLNGLLELEQLEFFAKRGVVVEPSNQDILTRIAKIYEGHPLVLKVIAEDILQEFAGDVSRYWPIYQAEFEQVARELQATRLDETEYNEALDRKVRQRIKKSLEKLPADALDLLCRSAVFRRPVPKKFWLAMIEDRSLQQQKVAYRILDDRTLIEKEGTDIRQHNLIRAIGYDLLKADTAVWISAERQAADLWLTAYKPSPNAPKLETVRGYLEAFDHYCEIRNWEEARKILLTPLEIFLKVHIPRQLEFWSYYKDGEKLCLKLLNKVTPDTDITCYLMLGNYNFHMSKYSHAIYFYQQSLTIARKVNDFLGEGNALGGLGLTCRRLGDYQQAIEYAQQWLTISRKIGDYRGESNALCGLGLAYHCLGKYQQAIDHTEQSFTIKHSIGDRRGEGNALGNLGLVYHALGKYQQAVNYTQQWLTIAHDISDRRGEGGALCNLGNSQIKLEQYSEALKNLHVALVIFCEICDLAGKAEVLKNLAELHQALGEVEVARHYCQQALSLAKELGIPLVAECEALQLKIENEQCKMETEGSGK